MAPLGALVILIVTATVVVGVMLVWVVVTAWRIIFPERPLPLMRSAAEIRRYRTSCGERVPVGFREIHEDMAEHSRRVRLTPTRDVLKDAGMPEAHAFPSDLWERRN